MKPKRKPERRPPRTAGRGAAPPVPSPSSLHRDLEALSRNLWWSWCPEAGALWRRASEELPASRRKDLLRNPVRLARALDGRALERLASEPSYVLLHERVLRLFERATQGSEGSLGISRDAPVAYFSMEFGAHESLPIYAGGLGILAGDHAKSASDIGLPLVGIGLFYAGGYFRQEMDEDGRHRVTYPRARPSELPIETVESSGGRDLLIPVELPGRTVRLKVRRVHVGRVDLLLLDSDVPGNRPDDRKITRRLYGGTREDRIEQEVIVGIGGVRALRALGLKPAVWHLNEGHVVLLTLERLREVREELSLPVAEALEVIAADTVFTTHTPVAEGNETFDLALARRYLADHASAAGIPVEEYLSLGLDHGPDGQPFFSLSVLALRLSRFRNGVSRLHGQVSRKMWSHLWPGFRPEDVPITSITNGVHAATWVAPEMDELLRGAVGDDWAGRLDDAASWKRVSRLKERDLFRVKQGLKRDLVAFVRGREEARLERFGWSPERRRAAAEGLLDPEVFTIGFARRFALYKRSALIFRDRKRAARLFASRSRPLQIIFAGKPHPEEPKGQAVFNEISAIAKRREFHGKVVLLENYDIEAARYLVRGVDVWLNNPRRPLEASGTSGQKVPVNAGLNLSILDGWWEEGHSPRNGWAFGKAIEYSDPDLQDEEDARALYRVLEDEVLPLYYRRDRSGVPVGWFRRVKSSLRDLVPRFSTSRMVGEYARKLYRPAQENARRLLGENAKAARDLVAWKETVFRSWPLVHLRAVHAAPPASLVVEVFLGEIDPERIACRDDLGGDHPVRVAQALGPGHFRLAIQGAFGRRGDAPPGLRLFATHPLLAHPPELGLAIEIRL